MLIIEDISDVEMTSIKNAFEDSNLPMKVDVKRKSDLSDDFFRMIEKDLLPIGGTVASADSTSSQSSTL